MRDPVETYRGTVYPWEMDHVGHMNVRFYTAKFDEATFQLFTRIGLTPSYLRDQNRGMAAVQQNTTYSRELLAGDTIHIESEVLDITEKKLRFRHRMINSETGEEAAATELLGVHLDRGRRRSCPFPAPIMDAARSLLEPAA